MVLNPDCVRAVLLAVEACPFGEHLNVEKLSARLPKYTEECLWYTCLKLKEGGYLDLDLIQMSMSTMPDIKRIKDLTFSGHEFLANIQKDDVWQGVKEIGKKLGTTPLTSLAQIASGVATTLIKAHFGLS